MSEKKEYIERGAFIDFIDAGHLRYATEKVFSENDLVKMISERPAADVEPVVRARWMKHEDGDGVVCSHCGMWAAWCAPRLKTQHQSRYCPSCGCLMDMERSGSGE